jgi:hypothetical protein
MTKSNNLSISHTLSDSRGRIKKAKNKDPKKMKSEVAGPKVFENTKAVMGSERRVTNSKEREGVVARRKGKEERKTSDSG